MGKSLIGRILFASLLWLTVTVGVPIVAQAQDVTTYVPAGAKIFVPVLVVKQHELWPSVPEPWTLAGLVEQESCISLTHPKCWNPRAELKTSREYGFGFGQITVAYRSDGSERFNKFQELRQAHSGLRDWTWANRYDPGYQLVAVTEMAQGLWKRVNVAPGLTSTDKWAFTLSGYNGGVGGVLQDRRLCSNTRGCDSARWFGHVEKTSLKSKLPQREYAGQSWYEINRKHARNILTIRRIKYEPYWAKGV